MIIRIVLGLQLYLIIYCNCVATILVSLSVQYNAGKSFAVAVGYIEAI